MGKLLAASTSTQPGTHSPLPPASGSNGVLVDRTILWDDDAPMHFSYTPCLVEITSITGDVPQNAEFEFAVIHTNTGKLVSGKTYKLATSRTSDGVMHPTLPTTLPTAADLAANRRICILMLNREALSDSGLLADIEDSVSEGKWPRTAEEAEILSAALDLLRQILHTHGVLDLLSPGLREQITHFPGL